MAAEGQPSVYGADDSRWRCKTLNRAYMPAQLQTAKALQSRQSLRRFSLILKGFGVNRRGLVCFTVR